MSDKTSGVFPDPVKSCTLYTLSLTLSASVVHKTHKAFSV